MVDGINRVSKTFLKQDVNQNYRNVIDLFRIGKNIPAKCLKETAFR